jgi:arginyl-tRNA synthetase
MVMGMSTRKGTVVFLEDILDEAREVMHTQMKSNADKYATIEDPERTSDIIGITAVKIQDMSGKRGNDYEFDWKRMTSFEGDTGPYLQYAHVRLASVERKAAPDVVLPPYAERTSINTDLIANEPKAREILMLLLTYPDVVKKAMDTLEPSNIVTYLFRLCHAISSAWEVLLVRGQEKDVAVARLWLYTSTRDVLASAMKILSLTPLERM